MILVLVLFSYFVSSLGTSVVHILDLLDHSSVSVTFFQIPSLSLHPKFLKIFSSVWLISLWAYCSSLFALIFSLQFSLFLKLLFLYFLLFPKSYHTCLSFKFFISVVSYLFYYFLVSFSSSGTSSLCLSSCFMVVFQSAFIVCRDVTQLFVSLSLSLKNYVTSKFSIYSFNVEIHFPELFFFSIYLSVPGLSGSMRDL